jgi:hypothetical protein
MVGMCLPHIRDPLGALESVAARSKKTVIITQQALDDARPIMQMIGFPNPANIEHLRYAWWMLSEGCIENFMAIIGFKLKRKYRAAHKCVAYSPARDEQCTTFVFERCV